MRYRQVNAIVGCVLFCVLFISAGTAVFATTGEEAIELCTKEMIENANAVDVRDMDARDHEDRNYAYGTADFADLQDLHFRCRVSNGKVIRVQYLVRDPEFVNGRAWTEDRPEPTKHEIFELDEAAKSSPPPIAPSPKFERVPD